MYGHGKDPRVSEDITRILGIRNDRDPKPHEFLRTWSLTKCMPLVGPALSPREAREGPAPS